MGLISRVSSRTYREVPPADMSDSSKKANELSAQKVDLQNHIEELKSRFKLILKQAGADDLSFTGGNAANFCRTRMVTVRAPTNIALVKYWGKKNLKLNTPLNNSISATLDPNVMYSETTIKTSGDMKNDTMSLDGGAHEVVKNNRVITVLKEIRFLARRHYSKIEKEIKAADENADTSYLPPLSFFSQKFEITTSNNFPTAAGLASSASGYAALTFATAQLFGLTQDKRMMTQLTEIARQGSGSACRSLYGGFVEWQKGEEKDGSDSVAVQLEADEHWPDLRFIICVAKSTKKKVPSTQGMIKSQQTSMMLEYRVETAAERVLDFMRPNIKKRNFPVLSELIMRDSNMLHAICMDTFPPIEYLNSTSRKIMDMVHRYNGQSGEKVLAYTFDAGPNAVLVTTQKHCNKLCTLLVEHFAKRDHDGSIDADEFFHENSLPHSTEEVIELEGFEGEWGGLEFCIVTQIGKGPQVLREGTY